MNGLQRNMRMS